jgi:hypothetical protein
MTRAKDIARLQDMAVWSRKAVGYLDDKSVLEFLNDELLRV